MTTIEAVRAKLVANAAVTALVGARIHPQVAPDRVANPFVVLTVVTESRHQSFDGTRATRLVESRLQVDVYDPVYLTAHAAAEAVATVLDDLSADDISALNLDAQDLYEPETKLHRVSISYSVFR